MEMSGSSMGMSDPSVASSSNSSTRSMAMTSNMGGQMYFTTQLPFTMLFPGWVVLNGGQLAGAWFFAFFLALLFEALQALSSALAARWKRKMAKQLEAGGSKCNCGPACSEGTGVCCCSGKAPAGSSLLAKWWRAFSTIDHARALLRFAMAGVAYLMMLAVMTFNVAIFSAVIGGIYIGALLRRGRGVNEHSAADFHHFGNDSTLDRLPAGTGTSAAKLALLVRACSVTFLILTLVWVAKAEGGLGWHESSAFGWHAFLFGLGFPVLMSESLLAFTAPLFVFPAHKRAVALVWHVTLNLVTLVCIPLALAAIITYKARSGSPIAFPFFTLYSSHSWMGIAALVLWAVQFCVGLGKRFKAVPQEQRKVLRAIHPFLGKAVFVVGLATCASGFEDMQSSDLAGGGYGPYSTLSLLAPSACIVLIVLGLAVFAVLAISDVTRTGVDKTSANGDNSSLVRDVEA